MGNLYFYIFIHTVFTEPINLEGRLIAALHVSEEHAITAIANSKLKYFI